MCFVPRGRQGDLLIFREERESVRLRITHFRPGIDHSVLITRQLYRDDKAWGDTPRPSHGGEVRARRKYFPKPLEIS